MAQHAIALPAIPLSLILERWPLILPFTKVRLMVSVIASHETSDNNAYTGSVEPAERRELLQQKGITIWLTGLSASGKV